MKRLNKYEQDASVVNSTIGQIQQVVDTDGTTTQLNLPDGTTIIELSSTGATVTGDVTVGDDIFISSGGVINWNSGDVTITHSANTLTFGGASSGYKFDAAVAPSADDGAALGSTSLEWADLFLADGGVINWGNGGVTVTHTAASDSLTLSLDAANGLASTRFHVAVDNATKISVTSDGLTFAGDTAAANALDDYEEGTWTPVLTTDGVNFTSVTYDAARSGTYTKIGNVVFISLFMRTDAVTVGSATGNVVITQLPFTVGAAGFGGGEPSWTNGWAGEEPRGVSFDASSTTVGLYYWADVNASATNSAVADVATGANVNNLQITAFYMV